MANLNQPPKPDPHAWFTTLRQKHPDIANRVERRLEQIIREKQVERVKEGSERRLRRK